MSKGAKGAKPQKVQASLPLGEAGTKGLPPFLKLLGSPLVKQPLPSDFNIAEESDHLDSLWSTSADLQKHSFIQFVHAGGSGMVFETRTEAGAPSVALKIARKKLFAKDLTYPDAPTSLSPVAPQELHALRSVSHRNIVRLFEAIAGDRGVFAIATTFVRDPRPLDQFLLETLQRDPDPRGRKGLSPFSPERLDRACLFLVARFQEIAGAVAHMHAGGLYHCDIKPANILIDAGKQAILTDLGAAVDESWLRPDVATRVNFTWSYAHPALRDLVSDPKGISGGGLKASAKVAPTTRLARFDLFALARTLQETLGHLVREFGERCFAAYNFRYLHLLASLLLDGEIAPINTRIATRDGRHFVTDQALDYSVELFAAKKLTTAEQLVERLARFKKSAWARERVPELDRWSPDVINTGSGGPAPFSERVARVFRHPAIRRLREELQLGWIREVYPGANHSRWAHSLGVFSSVAEYYDALLEDPETPTGRILLTERDIEHALVAALLHDVGQTAFGHDIEASAPEIYRHEKLIPRLLDETAWGKPTLREEIGKAWPEVDLDRALSILGVQMGGSDGKPQEAESDPADGLARDAINGPIDADKLDYLVRDGVSAGVPYPLGIDRDRFLRALTVDVRTVSGVPRLALAYRAKGAAAVESVLLARYQMYGAVYWHHTFRCIQAMFSHATAATLKGLAGGKITLRGDEIETDLIREYFYFRVVCGLAMKDCKAHVGSRLPSRFYAEVGGEISSNRAIEFLWNCAEDDIRSLVAAIAGRRLYRRVFELRMADLGEAGDYSALAAELDAKKRVRIAERLRERFLISILKKMQQKGPVESLAESKAKTRHDELRNSKRPLVVVDFPTRGIPEEKNFPRPIADAARKYISGGTSAAAHGRSIFHTVKRLQVGIASLRVFAAPELHELVTRYLEPHEVQSCVESAVPAIKIQQ